MEIITNTSVNYNGITIKLPCAYGNGNFVNPEYIVIHSTANIGASAIQHINYWYHTPLYAVHYVGDWTGKVYQAVSERYVCNQVGNGNPWVIGIELCEPNNREDFEKVWRVGIEWAAWQLNKRGWGIGKLLSHNDCRIMWGGTDHTDPIPFFERWGKTWEDFKREVKEEMTMPSADEIWNYKINGIAAKERLYLNNKQLFDKKDYSGRGKDGATPIERITYMAAKQEKMQESIDKLIMIVDDLRDIVLRMKSGEK